MYKPKGSLFLLLMLGGFVCGGLARRKRPDSKGSTEVLTKNQRFNSSTTGGVHLHTSGTHPHPLAGRRLVYMYAYTPCLTHTPSPDAHCGTPRPISLRVRTCGGRAGNTWLFGYLSRVQDWSGTRLISGLS